MDILTVGYYIACMIIWLGLTGAAAAALRPGFPEWLEAHPRVMLYLLGINRLPLNPSRTLKRFYLFLAGGWTWILVWSWWWMPLLKDYFFRSTPTPIAFRIARISTLIVVGAYAAVGFFAIGRSLTIWFKDIYNSPLRK